MHGNWLNVSVGEVLTCVGCHEGHSKTTPLNTGINGVLTAGPGALDNWDANMTSQVLSGETMALALQRLASSQPTLVDADYASLHRDMVYKDYWSNALAFTPGTPIALEYNDRVYSTDADGNVLNQGLINTQVAPVIGPACAPVDFANPNDQPIWYVDSCMIVIDYVRHIQPMWEATRHVAYDTVTKTYTDGLCTDCHSTVNPVDGTAQVPMGISQLDLTQDGNGMRFIPNDVTQRYLSYEEMVEPGNELALDAMGNLVKVTQDVPDGMGGTVTVDVLIPAANLAIRTGREARNTRLLDILNNFRAGETVDHTIMMTDAEKRVLSEWIDLGLQYTNDRSNFPIN